MNHGTTTVAEFRALLKAQRKPHKYGAKKTTVDGITFDSKREAERYVELKALQRYGQIEKLVMQPAFVLQEPFVRPNGQKVRAIKYVADFQYIERKGLDRWFSVVEDVKGVETPVFKLKRKLFWAEYPNTELRIVK